MNKILILDFYTDEPSCFGVSPSISPKIRIVYGAALQYYPESSVDYATVDEIRDTWRIPAEYGAVFLYGGATVPGKYLSARIGTSAEAGKLLTENPRLRGKVYVDGALRFLPLDARNSLEKLGAVFLSPMELWLSGGYPLPGTSAELPTPPDYYERIRKASIAGAGLLPLHYRYPYVMVELETSMGCNRKVHCSFCADGINGNIASRPVGHLLEEMAALRDNGAEYFRLGCQSDLMTFHARKDTWANGFPQPDVSALESLYSGIRNTVPGLKVLHLDNINPGVIAAWPAESREILRIIATHNTPQDVAAMGMETADAEVVKNNHLKILPEDMLRVLGILQETGKSNGQWKIHPGLNFLSGLPGENMDTFRKNYDFLRNVLDLGILLRRINIRKVRVLEKTPLFSQLRTEKWRYTTRLENRFRYYKDKIRNDIDIPMLKKIYPTGTRISGVILEKKESWGFYGRPMGSYPITVKILASGALMDSLRNATERNHPWVTTNVTIIDHQERSILGISALDNLRDFSLPELKKILPERDAVELWSNPQQKALPDHISLDSVSDFLH